jgi:hypothetical protein
MAHLLKNQIQKHLDRKSKGYKAIYRGEVLQALEQIWQIHGQICFKRLQPFFQKSLQNGAKNNLCFGAKRLNIKQLASVMVALRKCIAGSVSSLYRIDLILAG